MNKQEKTDLIIAVSLLAAGAFVIWYANHRFKKSLKAQSKEWAEDYMQKGWEGIQKMSFFAKATPEERIKYFDAYWGTTGGRR